MATYLINAHGLNVGTVALPLALVGMGTVIGSYIGGPVANREDRMALISISAIAGGVAALALFSLDASTWVVVAVATASITLLSIPWPVLITLCTQVSGQSRATGIGLFGVSNQTGAVGGSALGGMLLANSGFPGIGYLCLAAVAFSAVIIAVFMRGAGADTKLLLDKPA